MKKLKYFIRTSESYPCFLLPIAEENTGLYFQQIIDEKNKVIGFSEAIFDVNKALLIPEEQQQEIELGCEAFYAFMTSEIDEPLLCKIDELILYLKEYSLKFLGEGGQYSNDILSAEKQYEIASFIGDNNLLHTVLVAAIESEVPEIEYWAYHEFFKLHQKHVISHQNKTEWRKKYEDYIVDKKNQLLINHLNKFIHGKRLRSNHYSEQTKYVIAVLNSLNNYIGSSRRISEVFERCVEISDVLAREVALEKGDVFVLSRDLNSTENVENILDVMAVNMADGTEYQYLFSKKCTSKERNAIINNIKANVLIRDPKINTRKQMKFYDLNLMKDSDDLLTAFHNFVYLKKGDKMEFYVLVPDKEEAIVGCAFLKLTDEVAKACWNRFDDTHREKLHKCIILLPVAV